MIKENVVKVSFRKLKYIHHISDIQIRNLKRHREYEEIFERTYNEIKKYKDNSVVYIGGDIAHSKTDMSPELIDQLSRLFKNLADIVPTIIITGNHDCNLNNLSRMDCLSPIVNNLKHPNLHYLKKTGVYKCADVRFVVWDVWDKEEDYIKAKDVEGDTKIVLYHGTVDQSKTDMGYKLPAKVKISHFRGYDLGLLGDIHKRQYINTKKTIAYCGSLIQQNHGEQLGHGYLLWDVQARKSKYIEIVNDYGYYTIDIDNGKLPEINDMPKKARLRVRTSNTSATQLKKALTVLHDVYGIEELTVMRTDALYTTQRIRNKSIQVGDVTDVDLQFQLIRDYLEINHIIDEDTLLEIKTLNENLNQVLPEEEVYRNINWKIKKFEFSNMFSYGKNNTVDFTRLSGIIGMFAPNASGKSALLDALSFCLYDTCSRAFKAENILNNKKKSFHCKINFEVDGQDYWIERVAKKMSKGNVKVDVEFWTIDEGGEVISLNGDQRRTTDANIRRVIGTYEDFILTALSSQIKNSVFIEKTQREKKTLLAQFIGLEIFDKLYQMALDEIKDVSAVLKNFRQNDWEKDLVEIKENKKESKQTHTELLQDKKTIQAKQKTLERNIISLTKKLKQTDKSVEDVDKLRETKQNLQNTLSEIDNEFGLVETKKEQTRALDIELKTKITKHRKDKIEEQFAKLGQFEKENVIINVEIDKLKIEVRNKLDKIEKLGDLEYDEDCKYCMTNPFTLDAIKTQEGLVEDKQLADSYVTKSDLLQEKIKRYNHIKSYKEDLEQCIVRLEKVVILKNELDSKYILLHEKKKNILHQLSATEEKIIKYYDQEKDIVYNTQVESEIDRINLELDDVVYQIDVVEDKITTIYGDIKVIDTRRKTILDNIKQVETLEGKYQAYQFYLDAVKRDGVPYQLISKALPTIESEVNNILSQLVDFQIIFEMDGKNINNYIVYDDDNIWPLALSSGMERFISSLAIRVGLINVSNLPRSNFLAIDEGWGTMDSDNINSVSQLFQYLKSQFQFTLIVSHIDSMRDFVDTLLEIKKEKDFSEINFG